MKSFQLLLFLFAFSTRSSAQQNHFIYIQTENKQAFYVKLADRLLSSSSTGYLVIPKLQDGTYELNIGFPKNEWPVQKIAVVVKGNDAGYLLKNFDLKGWGLFNMQTMEVLMSSGSGALNNPVKEKDTDEFAGTLSDVVSTPLNREKPVSAEEKDSTAAKSVVVEVDKPKQVIENKPLAAVKPAVKISSTEDASGRSVVYVDSSEDKLDTIMIFIPYVAEIKEKISQPVPVETVKKEEPKTDKQPVAPADRKFIDMELPNPNSKTDSASGNKVIPASNVDDKKEMTVETKSSAVIMTNSDCKTTASQDDFLKLRKKMAAEKTDEEMIEVARKAFKSRCFSTEQVNNLSVLFLKDEGRYNFFDAAYPRVSDTQNFAGLVSKLSDEYYITRFKAMIRH